MNLRHEYTYIHSCMVDWCVWLTLHHTCLYSSGHGNLYFLKIVIRYLNKKKQAEELVHEYESRPTVDYSLKDGQTLRLNIKSVRKWSQWTVLYHWHGRSFISFCNYCLYSNLQSSVSSSRSKFFDQNMDSLQRTQTSTIGPSVPFLAPPPNPAVPLTLLRAPSNTSNDTSTDFASCANSTTDVDDDFGDFQTACWTK